MTVPASPEYDTPSEYILQRRPFIVRRVVKFHDPAGVVYAGNFPTFAGSASHLFIGHLLGGPIHKMKKELGVDFPSKAYRFVFHSSLWPEDQVDMTVSVVHIGRSSFTIQVLGTRVDGTMVFAAHMTPICVVPGGPKTRQSAPIPPVLRAALEAHFNPSPHPMGD
jgi:acyl-CoA thioesterase FadM